jgi:hypothetical protein
MKNTLLNKLKISLLLLLVVMTSVNCERDLSDDAKDATFAKTAEIFIDAPVAMGSDFYFPYGGSKASAWSIDTQERYRGTASMRFDVPNDDDPEGNYAGAIFRVDGAGRNLTDYDALTFYAKASQGVTISEFGFGEDFYPNKYMATMTNVSVGTAWTKYIIPIPDASKLVQEKGMFRYAAGTQGTNGRGYTLWIDDLKFEKLGTILPLQASIMNGSNVTRTSFVGVEIPVTGVITTFNMPNGVNQSVTISPGYLNFTSSNPSVATVNDAGVVTPIAAGTAIITATFNNQPATGSLTINCSGSFTHAPVPTLNPANVISIFSDAYSNVPVSYYNGYWAPWQTTQSNDFAVLGDNVLNYTNFNFVGIEFSDPTVNATSMTHLHLDVYIPGPISPGRRLELRLTDFGPNGVFGVDDSQSLPFVLSNNLVSQSWMSFEIPLSQQIGLNSRSQLAQIILLGGDNSTLYVDNIYFHN